MARPNIIDERGLGDRALELHFRGLSQAQIAKELGIKEPSVQRWLAKNRKAKQIATKAEILPDFPTKSSIMVEISQEMAKQKLGQLVGECEKQYNHYCASSEDKAEEKAAYWFSQYQSAVEKLLRASGVYEKAKKDAEREPVESAIQIDINWRKPVKRPAGSTEDADEA